jgi:MFS family permease
MSLLSLLDRSHTIAKPGFSRWMVPPAALCIHLCIGQAYAFSVFNLPMTKLIGITRSAPNDWKLTALGWIFSIAIFVLGVSAATFGRWVEEGGPRKAMFTAGLCWAMGFFISALGVYIHNLWVIYLGYGVFGGLGLGIGYISPVSTLIKWFPDRPGMATGMAIMGFGGAALIASPLSVWLMAKFSTPTHLGVSETFICLGLIYLIFMWVGAAIVRVPPPGWKPQGYMPLLAEQKLITNNDVYVYDAIKTPQFWLIWWVLCLNVTAGIGVLGQASAMSQEMFPGKVSVVAAAGFVGLLSLFNMLGRFVWASASDYMGRKTTYSCIFVLGAVLYSLVPWISSIGSVSLFVLSFVVILSMYGGGFATVPAYLKDLFGTRYVGAIHGWLITAWSAAGVFGPVLLNYIREYQIGHGVPKAEAYNVTMFVMAGLLVVWVLLQSVRQGSPLTLSYEAGQ